MIGSNKSWPNQFALTFSLRSRAFATANEIALTFSCVLVCLPHNKYIVIITLLLLWLLVLRLLVLITVIQNFQRFFLFLKLWKHRCKFPTLRVSNLHVDVEKTRYVALFHAASLAGVLFLLRRPVINLLTGNECIIDST